jgi:hypothetical protein
MVNKKSRSMFGTQLFLLLIFAILVLMAGLAIFDLIGHEIFFGEAHIFWKTLFVFYVLSSIALIGGMVTSFWLSNKFLSAVQPVLDLRARFSWLNKILAFLLVAWPAWVLLYSRFNVVLDVFSIKLYFFVVAVAAGGFFLTNHQQKILNWQGLLKSIILFGAVFLMALMFVPVTGYPLSLTWSDGNRIWDYSVLFGRDLYNYPPDEPLKAYIDLGRQSLWGLPFLLPNVTLLQVRMWSALVFTIPYATLGWILFFIPKQKRSGWIFLGLWVMLFLHQGPIYTPLVLAAILVALARRWPLWIGLILTVVAGYYAQMSRFTWMFAPAIWATMMALYDHPLSFSRQKIKNWLIVASYALAGLIGGFGISGWRNFQDYLAKISGNVISSAIENAPTVTEQVTVAGSTSGFSSLITDQALLWSRLWPSATYTEGVILGLLLAAGPLAIYLLYLAFSKRWSLNFLQKLGLFLPMLVFLLVGIVISVKIGGGSNLHNLDMFLVGLVFVAAFAWDPVGLKIIQNLHHQSIWLRVLVFLLAAIPAFYPVITAEPRLPLDWEKAAYSIQKIQKESNRVIANGGEVLLMDQRQLLTFGYLENVPLVADYEKKKVMDKAMSGDVGYFTVFYEDISAQRFDMIVSEPLNANFAHREKEWAQENDIWVEWVGKPLLCYYQPKTQIEKTSIWILTPRSEPLDCTFPFPLP